MMSALKMSASSSTPKRCRSCTVWERCSCHGNGAMTLYPNKCWRKCPSLSKVGRCWPFWEPQVRQPGKLHTLIQIFFPEKGGGYGLPGWALRPSSSFRSEHGFFKLVKRILPSGIIIIVLYIYQKTNTNICSQMVKIKNEIKIGKVMSQSCYPVYVCY